MILKFLSLSSVNNNNEKAPDKSGAFFMLKIL